MRRNKISSLSILLPLLLCHGCNGNDFLWANKDEINPASSFLPGSIWKDEEGNKIQAHGGQIQKMPVPDGFGGKIEKYIWVGENKSNGNLGNNIAVYSSNDLYSWKYEGDVLRCLSERRQLDDDAYFSSLYADYTKEEKDDVFASIKNSNVIERPKMLYNRKNDNYVIWFHNDSTTNQHDSSYDAGMSGVAVSSSPFGPFKFIDRYRLNQCPKDQIDVYPFSKGEARDLNLFQDDDGTGYVVYTSENNKTLYISKLNDDYTYLSKDPKEAVYREDYIRIFPGAMREAPALIKGQDHRYYLMSSSTTGWASNEARVYSSDSLFGEWKYDGNPCIGKGSNITFDTQSTCLFQTENGQIVYCGDRWNKKDLSDSRYVWLPAEIRDHKLKIHWEKEWRLD